jgi:site-specific DNA-cytosine methylase
MRPVDYKAFYDRANTLKAESAIAPTAAALGMSADDFKRIAQAQGVDLEAIHRAGQKGRSYDEVATAARERGVIGFLSPEEREAQFRRVYDDVEKAVRGEAPDTIELKRAKADKGFGPAGALGGYVAAGTQAELPEVTKPGEHGYTVATLLIDALKDDAQASKVYDLYGRSLATGNTQKYIETRTEDLKRRAGISASQPDAVEKVAKLRRQAINEVIAYKTVGQWTPAITLGDIEVTEGREAPSFLGALKPNVEIIGFNNKRQAIFRQESPLGVLFRVIDIPQAAVSGVLMGQGATTGIQTGANFFEAALETTEGASPYVRYPVAGLGMAASVLAPDMLLVGGKAGKVARLAIDTARIRKIAPQVTDLLSTIAKSRAAQDFAAAKKAEIELRDLAPAVADQLDRYDASAAELMKLVDPTTDTAREDLTAIIGARIKAAEQEAAGRVWLHPSQRREVLEAKGKTKNTALADYDELFSTDKLLSRVAAARVAHEQSFPKTMAQYISNYAVGTTRDVLAPLAKATGLSAENIDRLSDIVRSVAPTALLSEAKFREQLQAALKADDTFKQDAFKGVRKALHVPGKGSLPNRMARKIKDIGSQTIDDLRQADLALLDRAAAAIEKNNEARAFAAAALMDEVASKGKLRVQPVNLFDDVAVLDKAGQPVRLSAAGQVFLKQLRRLMPDQDFTEAYRLAAVQDQIILSQAKRHGVDPFSLYKQKFPQFMRASEEDLARFGISKKVVPPTPTAPASPHGKKALKWSPKLGGPKVDVETVEAAKRYLLDARAGRYSSDAFATFTRADGTVGSYVLVFGDVRIVADSPLDGDDFNIIVKVGTETVEKPSVAANPMQALLFGVQEAEPLMEARVAKGAPAIEGVPEKLLLRNYKAPATVAEDLGEVTEAMETPIVGELDDLINEADRIMRRYDEAAGTALRDRVRASVYAEAERVLEGQATLEGLRERVGRLAENLSNIRGQKVTPPSFGALPQGARRLPPTAPEAARIRDVLKADPYASMDDLRDAFPMVDPTSLAKLRGEAQAPIIQRVKALSVDELERSLDIAEDALDGVENALQTGRMTADDAARVRRQLAGYTEFIERELETRAVVPSREVTAPVVAREVTETGLRPEREVTERITPTPAVEEVVEAPAAAPVVEAPAPTIAEPPTPAPIAAAAEAQPEAAKIVEAPAAEAPVPAKRPRATRAKPVAAEALTPAVVEEATTSTPQVEAALISTETTPSRIQIAAKQTNVRNPELVAMAKAVREGKATREQYDALVNRLRPITPYKQLPAPTPEAQMQTALKSNQKRKIGAPRQVAEGTPVGLRVDIPALQDHGAWVVTVHEKRKSKSPRSLAGSVIGYDNVAAVRNAEFVVPSENSILIASGVDNKMPYATIEGAWVPMTTEQAVARAQAAFNDPAWVQVGQDPLRHAYFYDRTTTQPIVGAEEVIQIGPLVLAKNPTYAPKEKFLYSKSALGEGHRTSSGIAYSKLMVEGVEDGVWSVTFANRDGMDRGFRRVRDADLTREFGEDTALTMRQEFRRNPDRIFIVEPYETDMVRALREHAGDDLDNLEVEPVNALSDAARVASDFGDEDIAEIALQLREKNLSGFTVSLNYTMDDANGAYWPTFNAVELSRRTTPQTVVHEIVHAMTTVRLANPDRLSAKGKQAVARINEVYRRVLNTPSINQNFYGLTDIDEFVAEAFSNVEFQRALNDIQVGQTTLWGRFVEAVAELLGLKPGSALSEVMAATETLMDEDVVMGGFRSRAPREGASLKTVLLAGQRPVAATLFSGGGLVEAGLQNVVRPGYAVEARGDIAAHYGKVFGEHIENADVRTVDFGKLKGKNIGYLHASPVCKNFSAAKAVNAAGEQALDIETAAATARALDELKPPVFTVENVADYADSDAMKLIEDALTRNGYTFDKNVYNAADYGAATARKRLILRAVRKGELPPLPEKTGPSDWYARVSDLVEALPKSSVPPWMEERLAAAGIDWRNLDRPLMVAGGSAGKNVPYAYAGGPTFTIKATPKELHRIILPGGDVREATPRVLARITGLPDVYPLPKTKDAAVTIIGNGIPLEMTDSIIAPLIASRTQPLRSPRAPQAVASADEVTETMGTDAGRLIRDTPVSMFKTVSPTGAVTGITEFMDDGRSIVYLMEGADASTVLDGMARTLRRNVVDVKDMDDVVAWLKTRGVTVGHQFGEFVGDPAEVQKAEDFFAKAFVQYALEGVSPSPALTDAFNGLKSTVANIYKVANDPVIGVQLQPQVRQVFDRVFADVTEQGGATLKQVLRRELVGEVEGEINIIDILSREAVRRGLPKAQTADLQKKFDDVVNATHARGERVSEATTVLDFPVPVMGKSTWTVGDLAEAQARRELKAQTERAAETGVDLDLLGRGRGKAGRIREETPVEFIRQALAPVEDEPALKAEVRSGLRMLASTFIGGDVALEKGVRELTPELRKAFDTGERVIEQHIGDAIAMLNDAVVRGSNKELLRYLAGSVDVRKMDGRPVISAGHDAMGAVLDMYRRSFASMDPALRTALTQLADAINSPNRGQAVANLGFDPTSGKPFAGVPAEMQATRDTAVKALDKILGLAEGTDDEAIGPALSKALRTAVDMPGSYRPSHEMRLAEVVTYLSGLTARPTAKGPRLFTGTSEQAAEILLKEVGGIYGSEEVSRRIAILVASFGSAQLGKDALMRMGLGINAKTREALVNWSVGKQPGVENINALSFTVSRYGADLDFVRDAVLDVDMYIPRMARDRMAKALARANYRPAGTTTAEDGFNVLYRYMKTRMTRGSFFIRQRYYMMNTVDHFTQISLQAGFGAGATSLARVLAQDLMVLPFWQQAYEAVRMLPFGKKLDPTFLERVRSGMTAKGDVWARRVGEWLSITKYHIEVNPILEGVDGGFRAGGKVYSYKTIRNIAVEEGVFASMATRELQSAIQREGTMFANAASNTITSASGKGAIINFLADWQKTVEDTAEAWSERERLGAMVTLMEMGHDPRMAARITVDALYDYSQSMTKMDRHFLVGVLFPFWAFQKNANQQVVNLIFSPWGAYRMMCIRRARERSADMLAEVLYNDVGGDYGLDVKSMPPELQDSYYAIVKAFEDSYGGEPPADAKRALRMLMQGRALTVEDGKFVELSSELQRLRTAGGFADLQRFADYTVMRPSKAERTGYLRERTGFAVPFPRTEAVRMYYRMAGDDHSYMEVFYPESVVEAGLKHITQIAATQLLIASYGADLLPGIDLKSQGLREVSPFRVAAPVADITRSPIIAPLLAGTVEDLTAPKKVSKVFAAGAEGLVAVHPWIGQQLDEAFGTTFLRVPAIMDPLVRDPSQLSEEDIERIRELQKQYPDASTVRDQRYYIPAGVWAVAFENSPIGELNQMLLRYEANPLERTDDRGEMLRWARGVAGVDVEMTSASRAAKYEEPTKLKETKGL